MKNIFKGVEIVFSASPIDRRAHNAHLEAVGLINHGNPDFSNRIEYVENYIAGCYGNFKFEREFTRRENGEVTLYVSAEGVVPVALRQGLAKLLEQETITSVTYGSMKDNATFQASKTKR